MPLPTTDRPTSDALSHLFPAQHRAKACSRCGGQGFIIPPILAREQCPRCGSVPRQVLDSFWFCDTCHTLIWSEVSDG